MTEHKEQCNKCKEAGWVACCSTSEHKEICHTKTCNNKTKDHALFCECNCSPSSEKEPCDGECNHDFCEGKQPPSPESKGMEDTHKEQSDWRCGKCDGADIPMHFRTCQKSEKEPCEWELAFEKSFNRRHTQMTHLKTKSEDCEVCVEDREKNPKGYSLTFLSEGSYWNRGLFEDIKDFIRTLLLSARQEADQRVAEAVRVEKQAWLDGKNCTMCGTTKTGKGYLSDLCGKCLEEM